MIRFVMISVAVIAVSAAATGVPGGATSIGWHEQAVVPADRLQDLTVPADRLPAGCELAPQSVPLANQRVMVLWNLPVSSNPWIGKDRSLLASIRGRMWGPPLMPDGPPLSRVELQRYNLRSADGLEAGYAAFYYSKPHEESFSVYAVRVDGAADMDEVAPRDHLEGQRIRIGRTVATVLGTANPGDCRTTVETYLRSVRP
jgi:hypothetical protein